MAWLQWILFVVPTALGLTSYPHENPQRHSDALIVCPGAEGISWSRVGDTDQLAYQVKVEYPAEDIIECISKRLSEYGWQPLREDFWNPGLPTSVVRGWTQFTDATVHPQATVDSWACQWQNQAGDIAWYFLQYRYPPNDRYTLFVNAGFLPANKAKNEPKTPQPKRGDFGSEMVTYIKQGRYDDAIQVGIKALENKPTDEMVYQQIANVYLIRAGKDEALREKWVSNAISYTEKALSLNSTDRDVAGVHVLQEALSFESAGDLSATDRCAYYERGKKLLTDRKPLLQGEQLTIGGKSYPLAPLRKENDKILARIAEKAAKTGCSQAGSRDVYEDLESKSRTTGRCVPVNAQTVHLGYWEELLRFPD